MASDKVIQEATNKVFCQRVGFMAIQVADQVSMESPDTPDHDARLAYAQQIFRGDDKALLVALHVVANSSNIEGALANGSHTDVQDADIQKAIETIWTARALAFGVVNRQMNMAQKIIDDTVKVVNETQEAIAVMQSAMAKDIPLPQE